MALCNLTRLWPARLRAGAARGALALAVAVLGAMLTVAAVASEQRPHILIVLCDDLGRGDYSAYGTPDIRTPAIDRLFREGLEMVNFRASSPVCSPTRAALLTGLHPDRAGVPGVIRTHAENSWGFLRPDVTLLPQMLKKAGYRTALVGKWHLGLTAPNLPNVRGFDSFHGFLGDMMDDYRSHRRHGNNYMRRNDRPIDPEGHATDLFTAWACEELQAAARSRKPFFLYLAYNAPHDPIQPPADWLGRVRQRQPGLGDRRARLVALIEHLDAGIGRVLDTLDRTGLAQRTVVIFSSDNGGVLGLGANNGRWAGEKGHMYDGGLRVPFAVRWPGRIRPAGTNAWTAFTPDIFPTCCEIARIPPPPGLDGISLLPAFLNPASAAPRRDLYFVRREGGAAYGGKTIEAIVRGDWKLMQDSPFGPQALFNLADDPREERDRSREQFDIFQELSAALRLQIQQGGALRWQPTP